MNRNIILWILTIIVIIIFWISIRTPEYQLEYTLAALGVWLIVFLLNRSYRKSQKED